MTRAEHLSGSDRVFEAISRVDPDGDCEWSSTCRAIFRAWNLTSFAIACPSEGERQRDRDPRR